VELTTLPDYPYPLQIFVDPDRMRFPPPGLNEGEDWPLTVMLLNDRCLSIDELSEGRITLSSPSDRLVVWTPGGAGYGPPDRQDAALLASDEESGLIG
jgi:N-methylhydantoinase B/oxoprolinase/acetone carboxylase alpha subunit